jgi:ankyrin repeat protein
VRKIVGLMKIDRHLRLREVIGRGAYHDILSITGVKSVINQAYDDLSTPLLIACQKDNIEIVALLLSLGASPDISGMYGNYPIHMAAANGNFEIAKLLVNHGANPCPLGLDGWSPAFYLCTKGINDHEFMDFLLAYDSIRRRDTKKSTLLHVAVRRKSLEFCRYLLVKGIKVSPCDRYGHTPLYDAMRNELVDIAELLLSYGGKVSEGRYGISTMHCACERDSVRMVELINRLEHTNLSITTKDGVTLCMTAAWNGSSDVLNWLIQNGSPVYGSDTKHLMNALHCAVVNGSIECIAMLCKYDTGLCS